MPPPPPPAPPATPGLGIVHRINARFEGGAPSNDLDGESPAGVLVHSSDGLWNPGSEKSTKDVRLWLPCANGDWCAPYADRLSASIISRRLPYPFSYRNPSFVIRPAVGRDAISCMFAGDGSSMDRRCSPPGIRPDCRPGCYVAPGPRCANAWKAGNAGKWHLGENCFDRGHLKEALEVHERTHAYSHVDWCMQGTGCEHNELILDASVWLDRMPESVEAIFYSARASPEEQEWARRVHGAFLAAYRLSADELPLMRLTLSRVSDVFELAAPPPPPSPPSPPPQVGATPCDGRAVPWCPRFAEWIDSPGADEGKFMRLWGRAGWHLRKPGEPACWTDWSDGGRRFFADAIEGKLCDHNWFEGAAGDGPEARPCCGQRAPALLGFDETIWQYCSRAVGKAAVSSAFSQSELAWRCILSDNNILRINGGRWKWNMCQNFVWQMCAAQGKLPGQEGDALRFASAPASLTLQEWRQPTSWPCEGGACPDGKYAVGDVFYAELAIFRYVCRNAEAMLRAAVGQKVTCDLDPRAFQDLSMRMIAHAAGGHQ